MTEWLAGCGGKPALNQNRMQPNYKLARMAERIRGLIRSSMGGRTISEREFDALALELFALQYEENPPYRRLCEARGVCPASIRKREDIPFVPTTAFKDFEFSCLPAGEWVRVFHSSGTTEQRPSRHVHGVDSLALYEDSLWLWFEKHVLAGLDAGFKLICLTPGPEQAPHSSLVHMFRTIRTRTSAGGEVFLGHVWAGGWELASEGVCETLSSAGREGQPVLLMGTAFNFVQLLDAWTRVGAQGVLPPGSRILETGGYKGRTRSLAKPELYAALGRTFGVGEGWIISEYGMSELSSQAYDRQAGEDSHDRVFRFPPWVRAEVLAPETGTLAAPAELGLLRVVDLANVYSVAAVQTEDLVISRGSGFELVGRAAGSEPRGCSLMTAGPA